MPFFHTKSALLHYSDFKPEDREPKKVLVFHHGLGSSQNFYVPLIPILQEHGYRCVAFDAHGAGRSTYSGIEYSVEKLGQDLLDLMTHLDITNAVIVGHSMGG
jgi:pimeloyl-ACP methyl ester carboxylesterase